MIRHNLRQVDGSILKISEATPDREELKILLSRFNSYLGYLSQYKTFKIRKELWEGCEGYRKFFYIDANYRKISIKPKYLPYLAEPATPEELGLFPED